MKIACKLFFHCHCKFWFNNLQNAAKQKLNFCELLPDTMLTIRYGMPRSLLNSSALLIISSNISHDLFSKGEVRTNCSIWETQFMTNIKSGFFQIGSKVEFYIHLVQKLSFSRYLTFLLSIFFLQCNIYMYVMWKKFYLVQHNYNSTFIWQSFFSTLSTHQSSLILIKIWLPP